jgi:esterase/lipase superfamily enzyme
MDETTDVAGGRSRDDLPGVADELVQTLIQLAAVVEESLRSAPTSGRAARASWVATLENNTVELRRTLSSQVGDLGSVGVATGLLEDHLNALTEAFGAPSLRARRITARALSLLLARIVGFIHGSLGFLGEVAHERNLPQIAGRCAFLADLVSEAARRSAPFASPGRYANFVAALGKWADVSSLPSAIPHASSESSLPRPSRGSEGAPLSGLAGAPAIGRNLRAGSSIEISTPVIPPELRAEEGLPSDRTHRVWYGTERSPTHPRDPASGYGAMAGASLNLGSCLVFVPKAHQVGSLGSSWVMRTLLGRSDDRLNLTLITPLVRQAFLDSIAADLARRRGLRSALVYVHGFNVSFEEAACRAAQIGCDLCVDGITAFYSWASAGTLRAYLHDEESVRMAVDPFLEFLSTLQEVHGLERIDILAHSMGNRLLAAAIERLAGSKRSTAIGHLVLASPDMTRSEFNSLFPFYSSVATARMTLYSCSQDKALAVSTKLHNYLRLGAEPPIFAHAGLDTVSASRLPLDLWGHGFVASARAVIADLKQLLWRGAVPASRNLIAVPDPETAEYWILPGSQ